VVVMRAERRRRTRTSTRGRRWVLPRHRVRATASTQTMSAAHGEVIVVRSCRALRAMEADLRSADRGLPVVGHTRGASRRVLLAPRSRPSCSPFGIALYLQSAGTIHRSRVTAAILRQGRAPVGRLMTLEMLQTVALGQIGLIHRRGA
jgi:hypothetical protein